jgi:hypothetical protein
MLLHHVLPLCRHYNLEERVSTCCSYIVMKMAEENKQEIKRLCSSLLSCLIAPVEPGQTGQFHLSNEGKFLMTGSDERSVTRMISDARCRESGPTKKKASKTAGKNRPFVRGRRDLVEAACQPLKKSIMTCLNLFNCFFAPS